MFPLAFVAGSLQGHCGGFIIRNYIVWPIFFLTNLFVAPKVTHLGSPRLGKKELVCVLLVYLFVLYVFVFVIFLFLLVSEVGCGL